MSNNKDQELERLKLLEKKLSSLEDLLGSWKQENEVVEAKQMNRWKHLALRYATITGVLIGFFWTCSEMVAWYYDQLQIRNMAEKYATAAQEVFEEVNKSAIALNLIDKAIELESDNPDYRFQSAYYRSAKVIEVLYNLDRPFSQDELDMAYNCLAEAKFLKEIRPNLEYSYIIETQIYIALKDYDKAKLSIKKALELNPDNVRTKELVGLLLLMRNDLDKAEDFISKTLNENPKNKHILLLYGTILSAKNKKQEAIEEFNKALELDPKFDDAYYRLALCYLSDEFEDLDLAEKNLEIALELDPLRKEINYQLGILYKKYAMFDISLIFLDKAIDIDPDYLMAIKFRASIYFEQGKYEKSQLEYTRAITLDSYNDSLYLKRGEAIFSQGDFEGAIKDFNFALEINELNTKAIVLLVKIYKKINKSDLALAVLKKYLSLMPKDEEMLNLKLSLQKEAL